MVLFGVLGTMSGDLACGGAFGPLKPFFGVLGLEPLAVDFT